MLSAPVVTTAPRPAEPPQAEPACRLCGARLHHSLLDLGRVPLATHTIAPGSTDDQPYKLHARICDNCSLVQLQDTAAPDTITAPQPDLSADPIIGQNEARGWFDGMRKRLRLDAGSLVIEVGCHDGTLLRHFQAADIRVLGIKSPTTAAETGFPTATSPFNAETAMQIAVRYGCADLVIANNLLPHARDLFDLAAGLACILRPNGILALQMPHLLSILQTNQFDAFRHDCYSYLSLRVLENVLRSVGLRVFDAERLPDHGGSLRVLACHVIGPHATRPGLKATRLAEGYTDVGRHELYTGFSHRVAAAQHDIRDFLHNRTSAGRRVVGYGAAAGGAMLLNCCGITTREIATIADPDPGKHGRLLPGSRIPIVPLEALIANPPDDVVILPWPNLTEIVQQLMPLRALGTQFWTPIPRLARV